MKYGLRRISNRIRSEIIELEQVLQRIEEGWKRAKRSGDNYYLDGVALNLHGFYSELERIFEIIAINVDGIKPEGESWHQELLKKMAEEISEIRPAVISNSSFQRLNDYRGFRHVVRNIYTFNIEPAKMQKLVEGAPKLFRQVRDELLAFAEFMEQAG